MQLYSEGGTWFKKKSPLEKISFLVNWPLSQRAIKCQQASWPEDDAKPLRPLYNFIWSTWFWQASGLLTPPDSVFIPMYKKSIQANLKIKKSDEFLERLIPPCHSFFPLLAEFPSGAWVLATSTYLPRLLSSTREEAQGGAPSDIQVALVAQHRWFKFLVLEFYWYPT